MNTIKRVLLVTFFSSLLSININATSIEKQIETKENTKGIGSEYTLTIPATKSKPVESIYKFKKRNNTEWVQMSRDIKNGKFNSTKFEVQSHVYSTFKYDSSKSCSTVTVPTADSINSCAQIISSNSYSSKGVDRLNKVIRYTNGIESSKSVYTRTNANKIKELQQYYNYPNGKLKKYNKYYGGKNLSATVVSYNKVYSLNKNTKNQTTSTSIMENTHTWNYKAKTIVTRANFYAYNSNGKLKQSNNFYKSPKYNTYYKKVYTSYTTNGIKKQRIINNYNERGIIVTKYDYRYNKAGQLKSNKNGKAYRYFTSYKKGKKVKTKKRTY